MAVWTTLDQTKNIAQGAAQGALDLVAAQHYVKASEVDNTLSDQSEMPVQNKVITAEIERQNEEIAKKVSVEMIGNNLIFH